MGDAAGGAGASSGGGGGGGSGGGGGGDAIAFVPVAVTEAARASFLEPVLAVLRAETALVALEAGPEAAASCVADALVSPLAPGALALMPIVEGDAEGVSTIMRAFVRNRMCLTGAPPRGVAFARPDVTASPAAVAAALQECMAADEAVVAEVRDAVVGALTCAFGADRAPGGRMPWTSFRA